MKGVRRHLGVAALLVSCAAAQVPGTVELQDIRALRDQGGVRVEIHLSGKAQPLVEKATQPDRLIVVLPNTVPGREQGRMEVNFNGVRSVRTALHSQTPPETHVVVDLDQALPYTIATDNNSIILRFTGVTGSRSRGNGAAPAAASGSLIGVFRRRRQPQSAEASDRASLAPVQPPPALPPIIFPDDHGATAAASTGSPTSAPTAAHPNRGSLQEGTVFPSLGSPESGKVPPVSGAGTGAYPPAVAAAAGPSAKPREDSQNVDKQDQPISGSMPARVELRADNFRATALDQPVTLAPVLQDQPNPKVSPQTSAGQAGVTNSVIAAQANSAPVPSAGAQTSAMPPVGTQGSTPIAKEATGTPAGEAASPTLTLRSAPDLKTVFRVKYVAQGVAYLDGGRSSGLAEGMKLEVRDADLPATVGAVANPDDPRGVAELEVTAVAETSAVTDIHQPKREVKPGDLAYLSSADEASLVQQRALSATRKYPAVITFTEGDPLDEEARAEVPRPPLPSVNRARGRIGVDYLGTSSHGTGAATSTDLGLVLRADITRINGTYWNVSGYWRGRLSSRASNAQPTLQDLINRTYHLSMTYDNPNSAWVAGFGRLYLPWASSLDTIDGGYFGRKLSAGSTTGIFAGSTPDPTSWNYSPDRRIAGAFINFEGGSYDTLHYTSTSGLGVSTLKWQIDRPFVFFENGLFYKRYLSIYDSMQADSPRGNSAVPSPGPGLSRNFLTIRVQPHPRFELDFNHNYFRDIPTFDPQLVGTGLLDKYLFQGFSVGGRIEVVKNVSVYTNLGFSNRTGDSKNSLNELFGITFLRLPWLGLRADGHYSRFNSSFGDGSYRSISLSRDIGEGLRVEGLFGQQRFTSALAGNDSAKFVTGMVDWSIGTRYFLQSGVTVNRGGLQNYDQWSITLGYRFDNRSRKQQ